MDMNTAEKLAHYRDAITAIALAPYTDGISRLDATDALAEAGDHLVCPRCQRSIETGQNSVQGVHAMCLSETERQGDYIGI